MSSSSKILQTALKSQQAWAKTAGKAGAFWIFPGLLTAGWLLFPALDQEWKREVGLETDPSLIIKQVEAAKTARMEAFMKAKGIEKPKADEKEDEEEEEEEEEEAPPAEEEEEEEEAGPADEEEDVVEEGGDDEEEGGDDEEEEDDDEEAPPPKPLYDPVKGGDLTKDEMWDNFILKAIKMNDEDDDDDDEDGEFHFGGT